MLKFGNFILKNRNEWQRQVRSVGAPGLGPLAAATDGWPAEGSSGWTAAGWRTAAPRTQTKAEDLHKGDLMTWPWVLFPESGRRAARRCLPGPYDALRALRPLADSGGGAGPKISQNATWEIL